MPVTVYSMSQLQGTVNSVEDILTKTVGVTIRSQGAVGSASAYLFALGRQAYWILYRRSTDER